MSPIQNLRRIFVAGLFLAVLSAPAFSQNVNDDVIGLAMELLNTQMDQGELPPPTAEFKLDEAFNDYNAAEVSTLLISADLNNQISPQLNQIYEQAYLMYFSDDDIQINAASNWLTNCTDTTSNSLAYKCSILLALNALHNQNTNELLSWSAKAAEQVNNETASPYNIGYAHYQTSEFLFLSWVMNNNLEQTVKAGYAFVNAARENDLPVGAFYHVPNLSAAASKNGDVATALATTELIVPLASELSPEEQNVLYYSLTARYAENGRFPDAIESFETLSSLDPPEARLFAASAYEIYAQANLGNFEYVRPQLSKLQSQLQTNGFADTEFSFLIDKAEILMLANDNKPELALAKALALSEKIEDKIKSQVSAERSKVSSEMSVMTETLRNQITERELAQTISDQKLKASRFGTLMLSLFLFFMAIAMSVLAYLLLRQKRLNTKLRAANEQALIGQRAKEQFIAVVGHELRTPLNPIINLCDVVARQLTDNHLKHLLLTVKNSGSSLLRIVENMIFISDASTSPQYYAETFDLEKLTLSVIAEYTDMIKANKMSDMPVPMPERILLSKTKGDHTVCNSKLGVKQIIQNLIDNSMKFTPNGQVHITLYSHDPKKTVITIEDTGIGMDQETLDEISSPFFQADMSLQRQYGGAGLGISAVKLWCELIGATVNYNSKVGTGTKVTVTLVRNPETDNGVILRAA